MKRLRLVNDAETAATRCRMFCAEPIGPHGFPGDNETKPCCPDCDEKVRFLCKEVMPAIRRDGYYSPPGSTAAEQREDRARQAGLRSTGAALLTELFGAENAAVMGWADDNPDSA